MSLENISMSLTNQPKNRRRQAIKYKAQGPLWRFQARKGTRNHGRVHFIHCNKLEVSSVPRDMDAPKITLFLGGGQRNYATWLHCNRIASFCSKKCGSDAQTQQEGCKSSGKKLPHWCKSRLLLYSQYSVLHFNAEHSFHKATDAAK
ncbi:hypothetical protein QQP08_004544 [Theobroma cacao]|nr:hypothetical protein QQP08_004544 [Theobroma cacao]